MSSPRFLVVDGAQHVWATPSSGRVISLGYQGLEFPTFKVIFETFRPIAVLDLRESASFRDRGFSVQRAFGLFSAAQVEYARLNEGLESTSLLPTSVLTSMMCWLSRGPVLLLGTPRVHQGSERERVAQWLSRERPLHLLFHDRDSHQRWRCLELFDPVPTVKVVSQAQNQLQLRLPLGPGFEAPVLSRKRRTQGPS